MIFVHNISVLLINRVQQSILDVGCGVLGGVCFESWAKILQRWHIFGHLKIFRIISGNTVPTYQVLFPSCPQIAETGTKGDRSDRDISDA